MRGQACLPGQLMRGQLSQSPAFLWTTLALKLLWITLAACTITLTTKNQCPGNMPRPATCPGTHHTIDPQPPHFFSLRQSPRPFWFCNRLAMHHGLPLVIGMWVRDGLMRRPSGNTSTLAFG